jgi:hypothetical protein
LSQIRASIIETKSGIRSESTENADNYLDIIGFEVVQAIKAANEVERLDVNGNSGYMEFQVAANTYFVSVQNTIAVPFSYDGLFQQELQALIKDAFKQNERDEAIVDLKVIETLIAQSNLLTTAQKSAHLIYASSLKYMKDFIYSDDLFNDGIAHTVGIPTWEDYYADCLDEALNSWEESPVATLLNHLDMPGTLLGCAGYATWQVVTR